TIAQTDGLANGAIFPVGTTTVTYTATDNAGNTLAQSFNVIISDKELPIIICDSDISQTADPDLCEAAVTITAPVTNDNCGVASILNDFNGTADASDNYPVGTTTILWTVTDIHNNINSCTQVVTITDDEDPSIVGLSANIPLDSDPGICGAITSWTEPTPDDNCPGSTIAQTDGLANGAIFPVGTTTVTYTATDNAGNTHAESFDVNISDKEIPSITCDANINQSASPGLCIAAVTVTTPVTNDNCGVASIVNDFNGNADASDNYPVGTTTV
ncbi:MAG: HYR domain-containing protein, partial [Psychroserpens sp.]|uniref:HYR domain-containing protein n=1 Tax=Psychroserpens sp. TaxID=2020870 RepID=UPI003001C99D